MIDGLLPIAMPHIGVSVTEGVVAAWHKREGELVVADEPVCDVSTDKVDTEVLAPATGTLVAIIVEVGDAVAVGAPLAMLMPTGVVPTQQPGAGTSDARSMLASAPSGGEGADAAARPRVTSGQPIVSISNGTEIGRAIESLVPDRTPARPVASPVARRLAQDHGIDLASLVGTGARGRICKADVIAAAGGRVADARGPSSGEGRVAARQSAQSGAATAPTSVGATGVPRGYETVPVTIVPTSPVRRAIAEHMVRSRRTAAHMTTEVEVDMHHVTGVRRALNDRTGPDGPARLSFLSFVARAACSALLDFPRLNASFDGERIFEWRTVNLSIAVDTDRGLLAPVIHGCDRLNVGAIAERVSELATRARDRTLTPEDMVGGTFTLSNPGSLGAVSAMAIINQPQVAILGMPAIVKRPTVVAAPGGGDAVAIRPIMALALTFDHRVVDGADATRCLMAIKQRLETWEESSFA